MDENKNNDVQPEWLTDLIEEGAERQKLKDPALYDEIQADDYAMFAAGLTHPENAETDRIIEQIKNLTQPEAPAEQPLFRDQEYTEAFGEGDDLEKVFSDEPYEAPAQPEEAESVDPEITEALEEYAPEPLEDQPQTTRKRRPKRKKGAGLFGIPHIIATAVWLAIVVMIGVSLGHLLWVCAADVLAFGREENEISVTIVDTDTMEDVSLKLYNAGLIRYPELFQMYAELSDAREKISSGTFTLNTIYDYNALVNSMTTYSSTREAVEVLIPEGYSCAQIFALLEEKGVCAAADLEAYAADGELDEYWFLNGVERGTANCLEGFLFPDTYEFYVNDEPERVLEKMLDDFDYRFNDELQSLYEELNLRLSETMANNGHDEDYIAAHQMSLREVITVASLIEKETSGAVESFTIASVIYNRLYDWGDTPPFLNIDAALLYVLGHKEELTQQDLATDTPYNTYLYQGLVPGPITNPGLDSIKAALNPEDTDYYYYVYDPEAGYHLFAKTQSGHEDNVAKVGS